MQSNEKLPLLSSKFCVMAIYLCVYVYIYIFTYTFVCKITLLFPVVTGDRSYSFS